MNAIHRIHFGRGNASPIQTQADYLGGKIKNTGDHKSELQHRITATWTTQDYVDLLWGKPRASVKWKLSVYDAVSAAKLMYVLSSIPFPRADANKIDAFQMRGLRGIFEIKHPYWSRVYNNRSLGIASDKLRNEQDKSCFERLSNRLIERLVVLLAHTIRFDERDPLKRIAVDETGDIIRSDFRRAGRPRTKWYDTTKNHAIKKLKGTSPEMSLLGAPKKKYMNS